MTIIPAPSPGVHPGTAMDVYHAWDAASNSRLNRLLKSPAHLRAYIETPPKDTPALALGRAIHSAILEPDDFATRYQVAGMCARALKSGKRKGEPCGLPGTSLRPEEGFLCGKHAEGIDDEEFDVTTLLLSQADHRIVSGIRDSVWSKQSATELLSGTGEVELSMTWTDPETGVLAKARWDRHTPELAGGSIVDVKTTTDASPRAFEQALFKYGYHRQGKMYLMGAEAQALPAKHYTIVAVEKSPPYAVAVYRLSSAVLDAVEDQVIALLRSYGECRRTGIYPDYPDEVRDLSIPAWAWGVMDEQTAEIEEAA